MKDEIAIPISLGRKNQEMIALGKAWCTHIRTDREGGIGLVEQMTGLPITGGGFTCDYAQQPADPLGMKLAETAVGFYENNCRGCENRSSGGRVPNLGTWAEERLTERAQRDEEEAMARQIAVTQSQERIAYRKSIIASFSAASQEIVDLVNKLDHNQYDEQAAESLQELVKLAPEAFSDEVKKILYAAVKQIKLPVILDVLVTLDSPMDRSVLRSLCVMAVQEGWGRSEGCRYLSKHGTVEDLTDDLIEGLVFQAAPKGWFMFGNGEPAALLHYHSLSPDVVESKIVTLLCDSESWRRAATAVATREIISTDVEVGIRLLEVLLDGLRCHDNRNDHNEVAKKMAEAVAFVIQNSPDVVQAAVDKRWSDASPAYRVRLLDCFHMLLHRSSDRVTYEVIRVVISQTISILSKPSIPLHYDYEEDYQVSASKLLKSALSVAPATELSTEKLVYLLLFWLQRDSEFNDSELDSPMGIYERIGVQARIGNIVQNIIDSLVVFGSRDPGAFLPVCVDLYNGTESTPNVRAKVMHVMGRVAAQSFEHMNNIISLIYTAMLGDDQVIRAAGLDAANEVMQKLPPESIPPLLAQAVSNGLTDQYQIVVFSAIKAIHQVPVDLIEHHVVVPKLLSIAQAYARDRIYDKWVSDALNIAMRFAQQNDIMLSSVYSVVLQIVNLMPAHSARDFLRRNSLLNKDSIWINTAIHVLCADENTQYEHLGFGDKEWLLRELSRQNLSTHQVDSLASIESEASLLDWNRLCLSTDVFAELIRPDISSSLISAFLENIPDTIEKSELRRSVYLTKLRFELEEVIVANDRDRQTQISQEVSKLQNGEDEYALPDLIEAMQARIALVDALYKVTEGSQTAESLEDALCAYQAKSKPGSKGDVIWAFLELMESLVHSIRWINACWNAEAESNRHANAARFRASDVVKYAHEKWPKSLTEAGRLLTELTDLNVPARVASKLSSIPLPPRLTGLFTSSDISQTCEPERQAEKPVVALLIRYNGEPVMRPTVLEPYTVHQFEVEARVNEWPSNADELKVVFISVLPSDILYASEPTFTADALRQPLEIKVAAKRPSSNPPLGLTARATFVSNSAQIDTRLVGNTTLELVTFNPDTTTLSNLPTAARQLQLMMSELRNALPDMSEKDRRDTQLLIEGVLRFAHTALEDRLLRQENTNINEALFQAKLEYFLRANPAIGARLDKEVSRAGGTTDLLLGNIVMELKVEKARPISLEGASDRFASQVIQYASAGDSQVSLLAVLDVSPKRAPAGVMGNEIKWVKPEITSGPNPPFPSFVGVIIVRSGFPRPSDYSR